VNDESNDRLEDRPGNRREFLIAAARWALFGLLGGGTALLLARHGGECLRPQSCPACAEFTGCPLPRAIAARQEAGGGEARG
jgi:hypothetical protein